MELSHWQKQAFYRDGYIQVPGVVPRVVVLVHYELAHSAAPNVSPHVRYALFFRLTYTEHDAHKWEAMTDIWLEYEGMRALLPES
ncbi:MAG TPA: hypothetical protein VFB21_26000 [Chthonomonadaceae bacterium]|nr:hypothetical protein [Chthonomonadaceae bacterium]